MVDMHCHILPEIDDGAKSYDEAFEMVKNAKKNNIGLIVATPHCIDYDRADELVFKRDEAVKLLDKMIKSFDIKVAIACGAELFLNNKIFTAGDLDELTVNKSRYMLCEFTLKYFDPQKAIIYTEELFSRGYIPIIAHPERYISFFKDPEIINELWDMGCLFQVNASSLAGDGGENMQEFAKELILRGFADFIATDAHSPRGRNNKILDKIDRFPAEIDDKRIRYLTQEAPLKVLKNEMFAKREAEFF